MATFLAVLKIIGIVLLVILAVLLVVALLVLFWPVRYYVDARIDETNLETEADKLKERIYAKAGFSWLLHFISGYISYPDEMSFNVKVLFFKIFPRKAKNGKDTDESYKECSSTDESDSEKKDLPTEMEEGFDEADDSNNESNTEKEDVSEDQIQTSDEKAGSGKSSSDEHTSDENSNESSSDADINNEDFSEDDSEDDSAEKKSFFDVLKSIQETVVKIIKTPQHVFTKIKCTISSICDKIDMIKRTLENDIFKRAFEVTKKQFLRVMKMILPKKIRADFLVGMSDPTQTADILAVYGILYPILVNKVYVTPDFDRSVLKGDIHIKGKIRVFTLVWAAAVLFFNKDVKKTIRRFKKILSE